LWVAHLSQGWEKLEGHLCLSKMDGWDQNRSRWDGS
jgi:hypothetical protein